MSGSNSNKTTIHVANIIEDRANLWTTFKNLSGFRRMAFHQDFCFVSFDDASNATKAIDFVQKKVDCAFV
jgi:hypothetical protein